MRKKCYILLVAAMAAACSKNVGDALPDVEADRSDSGISFRYANPAAALTYAGTVAATEAEKIIRDMDVFMFLSDGTFARQLTTADFNASNDTAGTTITLTNGLIAEYRGQQAVFYFVANNAASTAGKHIASFAGTEDDFRESLTRPLPVSTATLGTNAGKVVNITTDGGAGGLLMTAKSESVYLGGKRSETVALKRRVARFDVYNPKIAEGIRIENFYISNAKTQATLFSGSSSAHVIAVNSTEIVWGPDYGDYDTEGYYRSAFYLYPTDLHTTRIAIEVKNGANKIKMFELDSDLVIEANKRYRLIFDGDDLTVDNQTGDWDEGGTP